MYKHHIFAGCGFQLETYPYICHLATTACSVSLHLLMPPSPSSIPYSSPLLSSLSPAEVPLANYLRSPPPQPPDGDTCLPHSDVRGVPPVTGGSTRPFLVCFAPSFEIGAPLRPLTSPEDSSEQTPRNIQQMLNKVYKYQGSKFHLSVSPGQVDFPPDN